MVLSGLNNAVSIALVDRFFYNSATASFADGRCVDRTSEHPPKAPTTLDAPRYRGL